MKFILALLLIGNPFAFSAQLAFTKRVDVPKLIAEFSSNGFNAAGSSTTVHDGSIQYTSTGTHQYTIGEWFVQVSSWSAVNASAVDTMITNHVP